MKRSLKMVMILAAAGVACSAQSALAVLTWTTAVNKAGTTTNQMRSLALSQDGSNSVYVGYIQTSGTRDVHRHDWNPAYTLLNQRNDLATYGTQQPKAIATDDRGNVFIGNRNSGTNTSNISAHSSALVFSNSVGVGSPVLGGMTVVKSGASYYAYASFEGLGLVQRYNVTNPAAITIDATFGVAGSFNIPGGTANLRGIEVDSAGNIFVASRDDNKIYKVSADLSTTTSVALTRAMDVAMFGGNIYATSYTGTTSKISVFDSNLTFIEDISISTLDGNPYSRGASEGWSGIDIGADGRIWLVDQHYGSTGGTQDRLLVSSPIPAPGVMSLLALGGMIAARRRRN